MKWFIISGLAMMTLFSGCQSHTEEKAIPVATSPGQRLFLSNCVSCHMGPGSPPGPNASILDSKSVLSEGAFREQLRHPTSAMMRSFSEQELNNSEVHELYNYVQTRNKPKTE
jgi:mono/diheme cytochrome c family protein